MNNMEEFDPQHQFRVTVTVTDDPEQKSIGFGIEAVGNLELLIPIIAQEIFTPSTLAKIISGGSVKREKRRDTL